MHVSNREDAQALVLKQAREVERQREELTSAASHGFPKGMDADQDAVRKSERADQSAAVRAVQSRRMGLHTTKKKG